MDHLDIVVGGRILARPLLDSILKWVQQLLKKHFLRDWVTEEKNANRFPSTGM